MAEKKNLTIEEEKMAIDLLKSGLGGRKVAHKLGVSASFIWLKNKREWNIDLKVPYLKSLEGKWSGETNPNFQAKIVKTGAENPLSKWKKENPGYQDGEKNPSFGVKLTLEEIDLKTKKLVEFNKFRKGKTYIEVYGEKRAEEIGLAMSKGSVKRIAKQKNKLTNIENKMMLILQELKLDFEFQYPIDFYCVDFFIPHKKLVIQTDGCYWHGCSDHFKELDERQKNRVRLDHSCDSFLMNKGYQIFRFWEHEFKDRLDQIKSKIGGFCG